MMAARAGDGAADRMATGDASRAPGDAGTAALVDVLRRGEATLATERSETLPGKGWFGVQSVIPRKKWVKWVRLDSESIDRRGALDFQCNYLT